MRDFIDEYLRFTEDNASPEIFRLWSGIAAVSGALERRCWLMTRRGSVFPNLIVLLVSTPGIGKSEAIRPTEALWRGSKRLYISPKSLTDASLVDTVSQSGRVIAGAGAGVPDYEFHSLAIPLTEFGTLISGDATKMLNIINDIYDCPPSYSEQRRHFNDGEELNIVNPQLNILAGTQPAYLGLTLPEAAWGMGFTSRLLMIYSGTGAPVGSLFAEGASRASFGDLLMIFNHICAFNGQFIWDPRASAAMDTWYQAGLPPCPEHSKLQHYIPRRVLHALKLIMVATASRLASQGSALLRIEIEDVERAMLWLVGAEKVMPEIFREMTSRSDADLINELHFAMWRQWAKDQKPLHESMMFEFLSFRAPAEKLIGIVGMAEKMKIVEKIAGAPNYYKPLPRGKHGVE